METIPMVPEYAFEFAQNARDVLREDVKVFIQAPCFYDVHENTIFMDVIEFIRKTTNRKSVFVGIVDGEELYVHVEISRPCTVKFG